MARFELSMIFRAMISSWWEFAGGGKSLRELLVHPLAQQQRWRAIAIKLEQCKLRARRS
ncbi:hypothetical protein [Bradyrhizobium genosp. A]|uniref:hypothetical protein n=1 Tax=Bradyrhizobium genosp. A TaxID=83626 RepID=UPI003CFAF84F